MATASGVTTNLARGVVRHVWTLTSTASVGRPATLSRYPDKTVAVRGTFVNATVGICGSNQSATVALASLTTTVAPLLNDSRGAANTLSFTAPDTVVILENTNLVFPKILAFGATGALRNITVEIVAQSTRR